MSAPAKVKAVEGLALLRLPFPEYQISKLPKSYKKDAPKGKCAECGGYHGLPAVHLDYVGHAALTDRLLDADPNWNWEPMGFNPDGTPALDRNNGLWIRLTVCGVTRPGYGAADGKHGGDAMKEIIGDALRNAAMRFGAALDLWHKGALHLTEEEPGEQGSAGGPARRQVKEAQSASGGPDDARWAELVQLIEATHTKTGDLLQHYNAPDLGALTTHQADQAVRYLEKKLADMGEQPKPPTFGELLDDEIPELAK